jgi:hypothetical protein
MTETCPFCEQTHDPGHICQAEQRAYSEVVEELYANPEFRAEMDRWRPVGSPEGQRILRQLDLA